MCGIAGVIGIDDRDVSALAAAMLEPLAHRGPDGHGFFEDRGVLLVHRRLSIIDVAGSPQPMRTADGRYTIVFNGEILNFAELVLRYDLPRRTSGDTETLLELLVRKGPDALAELRGQFAFALYDSQRRTVLLGRDRLGVIPCYWTIAGGRFAFASEPKALRPVTGSFDVDLDAVTDFLIERVVPAPMTLMSGIRKLEAGCFMEVNVSSLGIRHGRYWSSADARPVLISPGEAPFRLEELLEAAVVEALVADVPVGAYLSGGVDSSIIVALATRLHGRVKTFAAGFAGGDGGRVAGGDGDERGYARTVSDRLGTDHYEVVVGAGDFLDDLARLSWYRDAPVSQTSDVAVAGLAKLASQHVKVVLSGEGSDELFCGYPKYRVARHVQRAALVPASARRALASGIGRVAGREERLSTALAVLAGETEWDRSRAWFSSFDPATAAALTGRIGRGRLPNVTMTGDAETRWSHADLGTWLSDNLLERGDRMTMASSIELRPPFLDPRVVDFALGLPGRTKVRGGVAKWPVKALAERLVGADIANRKKAGFPVPFGAWARGDLAGSIRDLLLDPTGFVGSTLDRTIVRTTVEEHLSGTRDRTKLIWALVSLETWHRTCIRADAGVVAGR